MKVTTKSGSVYILTQSVSKKSGLPVMVAQKVGYTGQDIVLAVYPDRVHFLEATTRFEFINSNLVVGYNAKGVVTLRFKPFDVRIGMILASKGGLRSTEIVSID